MKKRIGIITKSIDQGTSGSGSHLRQLVEALIENNRNFDLVFLHYWDKDLEIYRTHEHHLLPKNPLKAARKIKELQLDLIHYSPLTAMAPIWGLRGLKKVATVHGAAQAFLPDQYNLVHRLHERIVRPVIARMMDHVFTVSNHSREHLMGVYKVDPGRISLTPNAVSRDFLDTVNRVDSKPLLTGPYVFHLSKFSPRKNPWTILKAFAQVADKKGDLKLVLGGSGWDNPEVAHFLSQNKLSQRVLIPGFISQEDLINYMKNASVFVFPSFYEGFGMPNLESMACGTPVITSDAGAIPEVVMDAALIISPPDNREALSSEILRILEQPELASDLIVRGKLRYQEFSWQDSAGEVLKVYKELVE